MTKAADEWLEKFFLESDSNAINDILWSDAVAAFDAGLALGRKEAEPLVDGMQDGVDGLACALDDLVHCLEHRYVPTKEEVASCRLYFDDAREALEAYRRLTDDSQKEK